MINDLSIRKAQSADLDDALRIERLAFGGDTEARLVADLLDDPSAEPVVSLLAFDGARAVGHILFTAVGLEPQVPMVAALLAPLAVAPDAQRRGIGGRLVEAGLRHLSDAGVDLVFVLGYPDYYRRFGFQPAGAHGWDAPYPIPEENLDAWMLRELRPGVIGCYSGRVVCADMLDRAEYWRE